MSGEAFDKDKLYDVIIIGGGPAGLSAAIYLARAKYRALVLEKEQLGGQITITNQVVNYPGITEIDGKSLTATMQKQAEAFGAEFLMAEATGLDTEDEIKTVKTDKGDFKCFGILIATGAHPRSVGFKGEEEHKGRGVAYCATCDGEFFTGKEIFVIGGGYAAAEESVFLTKFAKHVTVVMRGEDFSCAASVADGARRNDKISIVTGTTVEEVSGDAGLNYIRFKNKKTGEITEYKTENGETFGVFVFVGYAPATELVRGVVELDEKGYVITDREQRTSVSGVYAAGDVCIKPLRQVVTATADGALAATELEKYVAELHRKLGFSAPGKESAAGSEKESAKAPQNGQKADSVLKKDSSGASSVDDTDGLFSEEVRTQLSSLFEKMDGRAVLSLYLDSRPVSGELEAFTKELASMTDKLTLRIVESNAPSDIAPCVKICREDGTETGLSFHGVPGGHEFTSFALGLYNAVGPGQKADEETLSAIEKIDKPTSIKVLVTLSCTMCPDTVVAAQYIAAKNPKVTATVYDVRHFEAERSRYNVMSVPCIVINDTKVYFGKKSISQLLELITK